MKSPMNCSIERATRTLAQWGLGVGCLLVTAGTAAAAVLVEQLPSNAAAGYYSNVNQPQQWADDFSLTAAAALDGVSWWGGYDTANGGIEDPGSDAFRVRVYSDIGGTGTVLHEFGSSSVIRTPTALVDAAGNSVYRYDLDLSAAPVGLPTGDLYLAIENLGASDWFWQAAGTGMSWYRGEDTDDWAAAPRDGDQLAFRLTTAASQTVPEPGTAGLALLAVVAWARTRQRPRAVATCP